MQSFRIGHRLIRLYTFRSHLHMDLHAPSDPHPQALQLGASFPYAADDEPHLPAEDDACLLDPASAFSTPRRWNPAGGATGGVHSRGPSYPNSPSSFAAAMAGPRWPLSAGGSPAGGAGGGDGGAFFACSPTHWELGRQTGPQPAAPAAQRRLFAHTSSRHGSVSTASALSRETSRLSDCLGPNACLPAPADSQPMAAGEPAVRRRRTMARTRSMPTKRRPSWIEGSEDETEGNDGGGPVQYSHNSGPCVQPAASPPRLRGLSGLEGSQWARKQQQLQQQQRGGADSGRWPGGEDQHSPRYVPQSPRNMQQSPINSPNSPRHGQQQPSAWASGGMPGPDVTGWLGTSPARRPGGMWVQTAPLSPAPMEPRPVDQWQQQHHVGGTPVGMRRSLEGRPPLPPSSPALEPAPGHVRPTAQRSLRAAPLAGGGGRAGSGSSGGSGGGSPTSATYWSSELPGVPEELIGGEQLGIDGAAAQQLAAVQLLESRASSSAPAPLRASDHDLDYSRRVSREGAFSGTWRPGSQSGSCTPPPVARSAFALQGQAAAAVRTPPRPVATGPDGFAAPRMPRSPFAQGNAQEVVPTAAAAAAADPVSPAPLARPPVVPRKLNSPFARQVIFAAAAAVSSSPDAGAVAASVGTASAAAPAAATAAAALQPSSAVSNALEDDVQASRGDWIAGKATATSCATAVAAAQQAARTLSGDLFLQSREEFRTNGSPRHSPARCQASGLAGRCPSGSSPLSRQGSSVRGP